MTWWGHPESLGMSHADFARFTDPLMRIRNYSRQDLLDMGARELQEVMEAARTTEAEVVRLQKQRR